MIYLATTNDWIVAYAMVILLGALGGFVAELLLRNDAGKIEKPRSLAKFIDLGFWANVIIGAAAALASLLFFGPHSVKFHGGTVDAYDVRSLIGIALIVGSSGGAVIAAMQSRILATIAQQKIEQVKAVVELAAADNAMPAPYASALRAVYAEPSADD